MKHKWISVVLAVVLVGLALGVLPVPRALAATKTWDGGAGTSNWSDANNWNDDVVPVVTDNVLLDNSLVRGELHRVNLP